MRDNTFKISYSRINTYLFCPQKYKLVYLDNKYIPLNADISFGLSIHKILEHYYKSSEYTYESMIDSFNLHWDSSGYETPQDVYVYYLRAKKTLKDFWNTYGKSKPKNILTEKRFETNIGQYQFIGIIDRIDESEDGTRELVDYKTHKTIWTQETIDNDLQLSLYCYACKTALGFLPEKIAIYFLSHNRKIYTSRNEDKIQHAVNVSLEVADKINKSEFDPNTSKCQYCDFKNSCDYSIVNDKEETK
ncbi:MAG: PD-(D/E)XK nuclease family protein [Endomicrobiaceae bacterium]|nr:PD-(D/E)XK nuclease family protein [Endomicrobiaceae bacterium]